MTRDDFPAGTVTLLFTDIEGSTKLLHALGETDYAKALAEHRRLFRRAFADHDGVEVDTQGDAFFVAFASALNALDAAAQASAGLAGGPLHVRMGVHTGSPLVTDEGYVGADVHRAARIAAIGHGDQVLVSSATADVISDAGVTLLDLGVHRLKDLAAPEHIYQLGDRSFPPLQSLSASNLPIPATPFLGRERELEGLSAILSDSAMRLITVSGPGGVGKTRLALQAAAESSPAFPSGLWWVPLAPLHDPELALAALGQTLGVREGEGVDLLEAIAARAASRMLVLLDNAEHLLPDLTDIVGRLLRSSQHLTVLVTSRERLQITAEHLIPVSPLNKLDAVALFRERAAALGLALHRSETVEALCERLDGLPLALQLAAARLRMFSPEQLLERLSDRLNLLKGVRDLEPRQRTMRAAIEWSHELLTPEEQLLFRRLVVFVGGCTLVAAEDICDADADALQGLVEKSLIQRSDDAPEPRFWMLESIRDFALEQMAGSDDLQALSSRHASYFGQLAEQADSILRSGEPEEFAVAMIGAEIDNLRAAVAFALQVGDASLVRRITASLPMYWMVRGLYREARAWLERALELDEEEDDTRRRLLSALALIAYGQGDHIEAVSASDEAASLAMQLGGATDQFAVLKQRAQAARMRGDVRLAEELYLEALEMAISVNNGVGISSCRLNLAYLANKTRRHERAQALLAENLPFVRARGQSRCEASTLASLAETSVYCDRPEDAAENSLNGARRASQIGDKPLEASCLDLFAVSAAARGDDRNAVAILAATETAREEMGLEPDDDEEAIRARARALVRPSDRVRQEASAEGRALDLAAALELAINAASDALGPAPRMRVGSGSRDRR